MASEALVAEDKEPERHRHAWRVICTCDAEDERVRRQEDGL